MKLITTRTQIRGIVKCWKKQYGYNFWKKSYGPCPDVIGFNNKKEIYDKLKTLDLEKVSAKAIEKIIGNSTWTDLKCNECNKKCKAVMRVGDKPDYDSNTAWLCEKCLRKALDAITGNTGV